jgi:hypothetical protein
MSRRIPGLGILIPLAAVGVFTSIAIDLDTIKAALPFPVVRFAIKAIALLLAATPSVISYAAAEKRHRQSSINQSCRDGIAELENILVSAISILFDGEPSNRIRANIMVKTKKNLEMLCGANMKIFPDYKMSLRIGQGCAGAAWQRAMRGSISECWKPVYTPKAQLTPRQLKSRRKLSEDQVRITRHILWVLSIPLFQNARGDRKLLGVLSFDGVNADLQHPERIEESGFICSCVATGERVSQVLLTQCASIMEQLDKGLKPK